MGSRRPSALTAERRAATLEEFVTARRACCRAAQAGLGPLITILTTRGGKRRIDQKLSRVSPSQGHDSCTPREPPHPLHLICAPPGVAFGFIVSPGDGRGLRRFD